MTSVDDQLLKDYLSIAFLVGNVEKPERLSKKF